MSWKQKKEEGALDAADLERLDDLDETTFLGFNKFTTARDLLPVYKSSERRFTLRKRDPVLSRQILLCGHNRGGRFGEDHS